MKDVVSSFELGQTILNDLNRVMWLEFAKGMLDELEGFSNTAFVWHSIKITEYLDAIKIAVTVDEDNVPHIFTDYEFAGEKRSIKAVNLRWEFDGELATIWIPRRNAARSFGIKMAANLIGEVLNAEDQDEAPNTAMKIQSALDSILGQPTHFQLSGQPCTFVNGLVMFHGARNGNAWVSVCRLRKEIK